MNKPGKPLPEGYKVVVIENQVKWNIVNGKESLYYLLRLENNQINVYLARMTSERDMPKNLVEELGSQSGVFGTSTSGCRNADGVPVDDQLDQFIKNYFEIWSAMRFKGVALGTDFNGMSPNIPCSSNIVLYNDDPAHPDPQKIAKSSIFSRTFNFTTDGLAHYGMLADLLQALEQYDERGADISKILLFKTAEHTINMWERIEEVLSHP